MMKRAWLGVLVFAAGLTAPARGGDEPRPVREARSENGRFLLRVEPGRLGRPGRGCVATLYETTETGARGQRVWERTLVNDAAPILAYVRNDGRFVVTLDEHQRGGARHPLVIYGAQGELLRHFVLTDLLRAEDWTHVKLSQRRVVWVTDARAVFDDSANHFVIRLAWGRELRVDLKTLRLLGARDSNAPELAAIPEAVLAELLALSAEATPTAAAGKSETPAEIAALSPEQQAQTDSIVQQLTPADSSVDAALSDSSAASGDAETSSALQPSPDQSPSASEGPGADPSPMSARRESAGLAEPPLPAAAAEPDPAIPPGSGTGITVPEPNPAERVDYVAWLNDLGQVAGPDAAAYYDVALQQAVPWPGAGDPFDRARLDSPEVRGWLAANQNALAAFHEGAQLDERGWNLHSDDGSLLKVLLPDLGPLRTLAKTSVLDGRRLAAEGRVGEAVTRYLDALSAGAHVGNGFTLIENLVGIAMQSHGAEALLDLAADPPAAVDFEALAEDVAVAYRPTRPAAEAIQGERAMFMDAAQRTWDYDPTTGAYVVNEAEARSFLELVDSDDDPQRVDALLRQLSNVGYEATIAEGRLYFDTLTDAVALPYPDAARALERVEAIVSDSAGANPFLRALAPSLARYNVVRTRGDALRRATVLVASLRAYQQRHGEYPASLDQLREAAPITDPFSEAPFVYRRAGHDFVLYSVGANGADDGGVGTPHADAGDLLFWPRPADRAARPLAR